MCAFFSPSVDIDMQRGHCLVENVRTSPPTTACVPSPGLSSHRTPLGFLSSKRRDLGHAVKQLKTALETNRTTIREKNSRIKALEERLANLSVSGDVDVVAGGVGGVGGRPTTTVLS